MLTATEIKGLKTKNRPYYVWDSNGERGTKTLMGEIGLSKSIRDRIQNHALNDVSSKHYDRYE